MTVRLFAPTGENGRRRLWQYCTVDYVGLGTYGCGVDFSRGTAARRAQGEWAARLLIDGDIVARKIFEIPPRQRRKRPSERPFAERAQKMRF